MNELDRTSMQNLIADLRNSIIQARAASDRNDVSAHDRLADDSSTLIEAVNARNDGWRQFVALLKDSDRSVRLSAAFQIIDHDIKRALPVLEAIRSEGCGSESSDARQMFDYVVKHGTPPQRARR